jgi:hypothetical protein
MVLLANVEEIFPIPVFGIVNGRQKIRALYDLVQRPLVIEREEFESYANSLKQKHQEIKVYEKKLKGKTYLVVQGRYNGKRTSSLYYSIEEKKVYMPISWLKNRQRLSLYILWRALGSMKKLKQVERKVVGIVEQRESELKNGE